MKDSIKSCDDSLVELVIKLHATGKGRKVFTRVRACYFEHFNVLIK